MFRKMLRITLPLLLLAMGIWLIARSAGPAAESVTRQEAIQALAPSGAFTSERAIQPNADQSGSPTIVNLADIPAGVYDPDNQLDRWRRGEIDLDEADGIRSAAELAQLREVAKNLPPMQSMESLLSTNVTGSIAPAVPLAGLSFDSIDYNECCGGGGNVPPDPELAAGPGHVIAVVNVAFEIYDKSGNSLVGPTTFASFMASDANCTGVFDPNVLYDEEADRFILGIDADGAHYCLAVSQTGDPTGSWNIYSFQTILRGREFFDYPHAGVGEDAIYMGANIFRGNSFLEGRIWAFDKWAMYNGNTATAVLRRLGPSDDTPQPLNLHGWNQGTWPTSGPHYIITETSYNGADHTIWSWKDPFGTNTFTVKSTVDLNAATGVTAGLPLDNPQATGGTIQGNDYRPQDFEYRNGHGWTAMTIACNPGSGSVNCVRWAQINLSTGTVVQAGVYGTNGDYRYFADLAVNHCDDMAIGYTKSNAGTYPAIWYAGRLGSDAAGALMPEAQIKAGEIEYTSFESSAPRRWGDYTGMTVDPDGETFWYLGEYSKNTGTADGRWGTWIARVDLGACTAGNPQPTPTPTDTPVPGPTATPTNPPVPPTPTNTPVPPTPTNTPVPGNEMHVGDLDGVGVRDGRTWTATVTILIEDDSGTAVSGATVDGSWDIAGTASCTTSSSGTCQVSLGNLLARDRRVTFTVDNVTGSLTYNPAQNSDPDGDSDGTSITIRRP